MDAIDKLKYIQEMDELLKDGDTALMDSQLSSLAPDMVSDGAGLKFKIINFYWLDLYEDPENPGVLFIFGKVKSPPPGTGYSSCCVVVKNIQRRILLLPRDKMADGTQVTHMEMHNEFYSVICPKYKIQSFSSTTTTKNDSFDVHQGTPPVAEYMEVRYSGTMPELPQDLSGETFSHAFGTHTPLAEIFMLEKKLKGPCWLEILPCEQIQPAQQQQSWCKFEFTCPSSSVTIHPDSSAFPAPTRLLFKREPNGIV